MTDFLKKLWGFVRPYRGRFFLGLLCGILYALTNGALLGAAKVVMDLIFTGSTNFHEQLANIWRRHRTGFIPSRIGCPAVPELPAPTSQLGWALVAGAIRHRAAPQHTVLLECLSDELVGHARHRRHPHKTVQPPAKSFARIFQPRQHWRFDRAHHRRHPGALQHVVVRLPPPSKTDNQQS